jgi:Xaa-Pro aminopeptidase
MVEAARQANGFADPGDNAAEDDKLLEYASEARLVKDSFEINEMRRAIAATKKGFDRILSRLPEAVGKPRSERMLEGAFNSVAREEGNTVGYDTIIASGKDAPILHWMRNTGVVGDGELLLIDAGVEVESLYTADISRTFPVNGTFTPLQRKLYQTVLDSQQAGFEAAQPGATYSDIHHACMRVIAERLHDWGILPVDVEESLSPRRPAASPLDRLRGGSPSRPRRARLRAGPLRVVSGRENHAGHDFSPSSRASISRRTICCCRPSCAASAFASKMTSS